MKDYSFNEKRAHTFAKIGLNIQPWPLLVSMPLLVGTTFSRGMSSCMIPYRLLLPLLITRGNIKGNIFLCLYVIREDNCYNIPGLQLLGKFGLNGNLHSVAKNTHLGQPFMVLCFLVVAFPQP